MSDLAVTDYRSFAHQLAAFRLDLSPAEVQGVICGLVCAGDASADVRWLGSWIGAVSLDEGHGAACRRQLLRIAQQTREQIEGEEGRFGLLLPGDEQPLAERAEALTEWSQGFLYGLGLTGVSEARLSGQAREVMQDFAEITRMDLNDLEETEENEQALTELHEYIWVAAMLLREELMPPEVSGHAAQ
jgi:uncharacterized protein YgfB (UPF0149 family)